jgi:hypothetical protein
VCGSNLTKQDAAWQVATAINDPAPELTHVQRLSAWVFAGIRAMPGTNAAHKQHAGTVIVFQIVDVGLEARSVTDRNAGSRAGFGRDNGTGCCVAIRVGPGPDWSPDSWRLHVRQTLVDVQACAQSVRRQNQESAKDNGCDSPHRLSQKTNHCEALFLLLSRMSAFTDARYPASLAPWMYSL